MGAMHRRLMLSGSKMTLGHTITEFFNSVCTRKEVTKNQQIKWKRSKIQGVNCNSFVLTDDSK
jgi:hypothetical protein